MKSQFGIREDYQHRESIDLFDDSTVDPYAWQCEVYAIARAMADAFNTKTVVDIGCGTGVKLNRFFPHHIFNRVFVETPECPCFERIALSSVPRDRIVFTGDLTDHLTRGQMIIFADVIEHLARPDKFLERIFRYWSPEVLVLSTPCRNDCHLEPPGNTAHFREWSEDELRDFVGSHMGREYEMISHFISSPVNGTQTMVIKSLV